MMRFFALLKSLTLQQQLRLMMGISLLGMITVIAFVMINLNQLRQEFRGDVAQRRGHGVGRRHPAQRHHARAQNISANLGEGQELAGRVAHGAAPYAEPVRAFLPRAQQDPPASSQPK